MTEEKFTPNKDYHSLQTPDEIADWLLTGDRQFHGQLPLPKYFSLGDSFPGAKKYFGFGGTEGSLGCVEGLRDFFNRELKSGAAQDNFKKALPLTLGKINFPDEIYIAMHMVDLACWIGADAILEAFPDTRLKIKALTVDKTSAAKFLPYMSDAKVALKNSERNPLTLIFRRTDFFRSKPRVKKASENSAIRPSAKVKKRNSARSEPTTS